MAEVPGSSAALWVHKNEDVLGEGFYPLEALPKVVLLKLWCVITGQVGAGIFDH